MKRVVCLLAVSAALFTDCRDLTAGVLSAHAYANAQGQFAGNTNPATKMGFAGFDSGNITGGLNAAASGSQSNSSVTPTGGITGQTSGSATANASINPASQSWELNTTASTSSQLFLPTNNGIGQEASAVSEGLAAWQDILFLSSTDPALIGHTLQLNFVSSGVFNGAILFSPETPDYRLAFQTSNRAFGSNATIGNPNVTPSPFGLGVGTSTVAAFNSIFGTIDGQSFSGPSGPLPNPSGWDSFSVTPLNADSFSYTGTWHLDIALGQGGFVAGVPGSVWYEVGIDQTAGATHFSTAGAFNSADSLSDPTGFTSITLPDVGNVTPESLGVSVTFDSGLLSPDLAPSTVPEPSTFTMSSILLIAFGVAWRLRSTKLNPERSDATQA